MPGYVAVANLVHTYAERIDAGDFAGVADLFANAEITTEGGGPVRSGRAQVLAMYEATTRRYGNGTPLTRHVTTNLIVEADDEAGSASCRSSYMVIQGVKGHPLQPIIVGRYHDRFARVDRVWRFAHRHILVDLLGDLSRHLLFDLPPSVGT